MLFETGRLCLKTAGREAGGLCVVLDKVDNDFVLVTGPRVLSGVKKRKCNIAHLEPLSVKLKMKSDAGDEDILEMLKKETELLKKLNLTIPSEADIKKWESQRTEKDKAKAEKAKIEQTKKEEDKKKAVGLSELASEKKSLEKEKKPVSLSDLASETRKLEEVRKKKESKPKEIKK
ncbi:MAG TPA: hypothetical protein VJB06_04090 [archaeon]|nr:hypothetical protein [archaeon]